MNAVALVAGLVMVAATGWLIVRRLSLPTFHAELLGCYVLGFGEIVVLSLCLSVLGAMQATTVLIAVAALFGCALAITLIRAGERTRPRAWREGAREIVRDPLLVLLGLAVTAGLAYSAVLLLLTPQNDWDSLNYHLARAALWIQQQGVGHIAGSDVVRIDINPPHAEIGTAFTMLLAGNDRYVGIVQFVAALATALGIFGLCRRAGIDARGASFAALAFLSLPVILLQSSTALNDLVVASFLVAATYFLLGAARVELALGATALALALGTKFTAFIALPLLVLVVLGGQPRRHWRGALLGILAGTCAGSYWVILNLIETGSVDGGAGELLGQHPDRSPADTGARFTRILVSFADDLNLEPDLRFYAVAAVILAIAVVIGARRGRRRWFAAVGIAAVACLPLVLADVHELALRVHEKLWLGVGRPDLAFINEEREALSPSTLHSYYGPVGFSILVFGLVAATIAWRHGAPRLALFVALAPVGMVALLVVALPYDPLRARFLVYGVALGAVTLGFVFRYRWLAWGLTSIAAVTVLMTYVHSIEKPAGVRLLDDSTASGIWGRPRIDVQLGQRGDGNAEAIRFFAQEQTGGRIGVDVREDDWIYPLFGRSLDREVVFADGSARDPSLRWLVIAPGRDEPGAAWELTLEARDGWRVYRRSHPSE